MADGLPALRVEHQRKALGAGAASLHRAFVEEDVDKLESAPQEVRSKGYDLVLNGSELGSGSIRIHSQELQARVSGFWD